MKAKAMDIWNVLHDILGSNLQRSESLTKRIITPADEEEAASARIAVTYKI